LPVDVPGFRMGHRLLDLLEMSQTDSPVVEKGKELRAVTIFELKGLVQAVY
jgi:hypothetical protein